MRRFVMLLLLVSATSLRAQSPRSAESLSPKAVADSLTAAITDQVTGRTMSRTSSFTILP